MLQPFALPQHIARRVGGGQRRLRYSMPFTIAVVSLFAALLGYGISGAAMPLLHGHHRLLRVERRFDNDDAGLSNPIALALWPGSLSGASLSYAPLEPGGHFCVLDTSPGTEHGLRLTAVEIYGQARTSSALVELGAVDAGGVTYDSHGQRLLILDRGRYNGHTPQLIETGCGSDATVTRYSLAGLDLTGASGMVFVPDPASASGGTLYFLDRGSNQLVGFAPDAFSGTVPGAVPAQAVTSVALPPALVTASEMNSASSLLTFNPHSRRFYILNPGGNELFELDEAGRLTATYEIVEEAALANPLSLVVAPSSDLTDDPDIINFYVVDAAEAASPSATNSIVELTLEPAGEPVPDVDIDPAVLEKTTHTYLFSPPSPDPAGIAYLPHRKSLLVSDSEVNEMDIFTGDNLFEVDLDGTLLGTLSTLSFSDEPTGVAYNPLNGDYFFSDDTGTRGIYHLRPGADGLYGMGSASVTFSPTSQFGNVDPEGITYDTVQGHLFIADGVNEEVYELSPGPNGLFDGLQGGQTDGDDELINHFDVSRYGIDDPAGIEFNPDNGHLYVMASDTDLIAETDIEGTLIRYIDIAPIGARSPAGLAYGPASGAGANLQAVKGAQTDNNLYIVDRMVDNDSNPNENDGELYEIVVPPYSSPPQPTATPSATQSAPTPTPSPTVPAPTTTPVATVSPDPSESTVQLHLPIVRQSQP